MKKSVTNCTNPRPDKVSGMIREWLENGLTISQKVVVLLCCLTLVGIGQVWGAAQCIVKLGSTTKATVNISSSNHASGTADVVSWSATNSSQTSSQWRFGETTTPATITFSVSSGYQISSVVMATGASYVGNWTSSAGTMSDLSCTGINATSVTLTTSSKARMNTITVTYAVAASCDNSPTIGDAAINTASNNGAFNWGTSPKTFPVKITTMGAGDGCSISEYGFVWQSGGSDPTISNNKTKIGESSSATSFSGNISGSFALGTTYKVKGYVTNDGGNTTLSTGTLTIIPRSVTFNKNGHGSESAPATQYVADGQKAASVSDLTDDGYTFGGWYTNADWTQGTQWNFESSTVTGDNVTLYAKWTAKATLSSIAITTPPTTMGYLVGETFSNAGAVVTATYSDATTANVTASTTWTPTTGLVAGSNTITASYTEGGVTRTTTTTVTGYTVTVNKVNMSGTPIDDAGVSASCSVRTLSQSVGSTNYKFEEYAVTAGGVTISDNSITGTPTGNVTINAKFHDPITVTWTKGGTTWSSGTPTTEVKYGTQWKNLTIPTAPGNSSLGECANKFMGWANCSDLVGTGNSAPAGLFTSVSGITTEITEPIEFKAVFATSSSGTKYLTQSEIAAFYCNENSCTPKTTVYANGPFTITSTDGDWTAICAAGVNTLYHVSIKNDKVTLSDTKSYRTYLHSPTYAENITKISIVATHGASADRVLYVSDSETDDPANNNIGSITVVKDNNTSQDIIPSSNTKSFYIYTTTSHSIRSVTVQYGSSSDYVTLCAVKHDLSSAVVPTGKAIVTLGAEEVAEGSTTTATYSDVADGFVFDHWSISGAGASLSSTTANPTTVTMGTADATVTAHIHRVVYLEATQFGDNAGAQFGIYSWENANSSNNWTSTAFMTDNDDCSSAHLYKGSIPCDHDRLIFLRNSNSATHPDKDNNLWNKTVDITVPSDKDFFTIASGGEGNSYTGSWSVFAPHYTVEFDKNTSANGVTDPSDQCVVKSTGRATEPTISNMSKGRLGYELVGWKDGETTWDFSSMGFTSDKTLTADWVEGATTTVALNPTWTGEGNTWDKADAIIYAHFYIDGTSQAQDVLMTKNICDGIFTAEAPYGATHVSFARCKSGTSSLGANWNDDSNIYNYVTGLAIAANYQYSITGWGSGKVGTSQKESGAYTPTTFTISFAGNSNTGGSMDDISSIVCDADQAIPANAFTRTGYNFTGWKANVDVTISSATVTAGTLIEGTPTIQNIQSNITLTAQWEIIVTTVTLNKNGATSGTNQTVSATYGSAMPTTTTAPADLVAPTKNGYTLLGYWDTSETTGGTKYYNANMTSAATWDKEVSSFTLYARWEINTDQFIDDMHGTDGYTSGSPHEESGASYTMPGPLDNTSKGDDCITSHYIFVGWVESSGQNSNGTLKDSGSRIYRPGETKHATNATYYAVWAEE